MYDEECTTTYDKHCKVNKKCVQIYQTQCHNSGGYSQTCSQVPAQTCYPETVCHKTPQTKCYQTRTQKCSKVIRAVPVEQESHQCLPFPGAARPHPVITPDICSAHHGHTSQAGGEGGHIEPQYENNNEHYGPPASGPAGFDNSGYVAPALDNDGYGAPISGVTELHNDGYGAPVSGVTQFDNDGYGAPISGVAQFDNDGYGAPVSGVAGFNNDGYGSPASGVINYNNDVFEAPLTGYGARVSGPESYASPSSSISVSG